MHFSLANVVRWSASTKRFRAANGQAPMVTSSGMARAWPVKMLACGRKPVAVTLVRIIHLHSNAVLVDICFRHATRLSASRMAQQNGERSLLCGTESDRSLRGGHLSIPEKKKTKKSHYCIPQSYQMKHRSFSWTFLSSAIWSHCGEREKIESLKARKKSLSTSGAAIRAGWWLCKNLREFFPLAEVVDMSLGLFPRCRGNITDGSEKKLGLGRPARTGDAETPAYFFIPTF